MVREGNYAKLGVTRQQEWTVFTFYGEKEDQCFVVLVNTQTGRKKKVEVPENFCLGSLRSIAISGLQTDHLMYYFEINGQKVMDPCAHAIMGRQVWNDCNRKKKHYEVYGAFAEENFNWGQDRHPEIPREQMIMYKLHVRGFTMDSGTRSAPGTFRALINRIPYLKKLGVTTLELMPVYEFEELEIEQPKELPEYIKWQEEKSDRIKPPKKGPKVMPKLNFWGYEKGNYFAVKASYGSDPAHAAEEFKTLIKKLHENGMECVMEFYFPDDTNHNLIMDALRYWVREYHIDGIHLLGQNLPITAILEDGMLSRTKIFYAYFDEKFCMERRRYKNLYVYKDEYQYPVRAMVNHINPDMRDFVNQQRKQGTFLGFVNYVASNNGFTLADLFMYNDKHNEANGENNTDGNCYNLSSNYGVEGPTRKRSVNEQRRQSMRNSILMLFLAQGVPLIWAGDEMGNSQEGNNNAYCQDNPTGWLNWKNEKAHRRQIEFVRKVIAFRKEHLVLANPAPFQFSDYKSCGCPDLSLHSSNAWVIEPTSGNLCLGMMYSGAYAPNDREEPDVYVAYNFMQNAEELALPKLKKGKGWYLCIDSGNDKDPYPKEAVLQEQRKIILRPQTICVLESREIGKNG